MACAMIGLLPRLLVDLAPCRVRQGFPFSQREDVPKLGLTNPLEVLIDPAGQVGCVLRLLCRHGCPLRWLFRLPARVYYYNTESTRAMRPTLKS